MALLVLLLVPSMLPLILTFMLRLLMWLLGLLVWVLVAPVARRIASTMLMRELLRHLRRASGQVDIYPAGILLGCILETQFLADLLDAGFDPLNMVRRMVSLSHNPANNNESEKCFPIAALSPLDLHV